MIIKVIVGNMESFFDGCTELTVDRKPAGFVDTGEEVFDLRTTYGGPLTGPVDCPETPEAAIHFKRHGEYRCMRVNTTCYLLNDNGRTIERLI